MSQSGMAAEAHGHGVIVVHQESEWVEALAPWLADGIRAGLRAVVVVTADHEAMLRQGLTVVGVDISAAALMVSRGEERAALDIERLCQELTASQPVSLHCVYAADVLSPADLGLVRQVFDLHTAVFVGGAVATPFTPSSAGAVVATPVDHRVELFPGVPQSIAKARCAPGSTTSTR